MARLMTAEQVREQFGLPSASTLRTMRARGLPAVRLGRAYLFEQADVERFIDDAKERICPDRIEVRRSNGFPSVDASTSSGSKPVESVPARLARQTAERLKGSSRTSSGSANDKSGEGSPSSRTR